MSSLEIFLLSGRLIVNVNYNVDKNDMKTIFPKFDYNITSHITFDGGNGLQEILATSLS